MPKVWKDLLLPGTYRLDDGRTVTYRDADVRNAERQGNAMLAAGLRVPMCWEHDPAADPAHGNEWLAKGYFGEPTKFERRADGRLYGLLDIPDQADADQLKKVRTVSPKLNFDYVDETGALWPGLTVGHVAATAMPVQRGQHAVSLSRATSRARDCHYLSYATRTEPTMDPTQRLMTALATLGVQVGDATSMDDLVMKVEAMAQASPAEPQEPDTDPATGGPPDGVAQGPSMPPVMMSRLNTLAAVEGKDLARRIDALFTSSRVNGPVRDALKGELKAANLSHASFRADGNLKPTRVALKIEAYEALPEGVFTAGKNRPANLSHLPPAGTAPADRPDAVAASGQDEARADLKARAESRK